MQKELTWFQVISTVVLSTILAGCSNLAVPPPPPPPPPPTAGRSPMNTSLVNPPVLAGRFTLSDDFPTVQSLLDNLRETATRKLQQQGLDNGEFEPDDNRQWARVTFSGSATEDWELGIQFMRNPEINSNVAQAWIRTAKLNDFAPSDADVRRIATRLKTALEGALPPQADDQPGQPRRSDPRLAAARPAKSRARKKARPKPG